MAKRGPRPQPAAVRRAKGNPGRRPVGEMPPAAATDSTGIVAPTWLKGAELDIWKRLAPPLAAMNILARIDAWTFGRYCANFARWLDMKRRLDETGAIYSVTTESGTVHRPDPAFMIADRLEKQLVAAEASFALNPAERQRYYAAKIAAGAQSRLPLQEAADAAKQEPAPEPAAAVDRGPVGLLN